MNVISNKIKQMQIDGKWLIEFIRGDHSGLESNIPSDAQIISVFMVDGNVCLIISSESFEDVDPIPGLIVDYREKE